MDCSVSNVDMVDLPEFIWTICMVYVWFFFFSFYWRMEIKHFRGHILGDLLVHVV